MSSMSAAVPTDHQGRDVAVDGGGDREEALGERRAAQPVQTRLVGVDADHHERDVLRGRDNRPYAGDPEPVAVGPRWRRQVDESVSVVAGHCCSSGVRLGRSRGCTGQRCSA